MERRLLDRVANSLCCALTGTSLGIVSLSILKSKPLDAFGGHAVVAIVGTSIMYCLIALWSFVRTSKKGKILE